MIKYWPGRPGTYRTYVPPTRLEVAQAHKKTAERALTKATLAYASALNDLTREEAAAAPCTCCPQHGGQR
jgi:hypothetical protein